MDSEQALEDEIISKVRSGEIDAAVEQARQVVKQYPQSSRLHQVLGAALFKKGLNEEARAAFRRAIELDATVAENFFNLALVELSENRLAEAIPLLEKCSSLDPENAQPHLLLGRAYHNLNQTVSAIEHFKKALALAPRLPLGHYHLGYAYQSQGNMEQAILEFRRSEERRVGKECRSRWSPYH